MRSHEAAAESDIERSQGYDRSVKKVGKNIAGIAAGGIAGRVMPFLSEYIPKELALKGINKVSPKLGEFLNRGMSHGLDLQEGLDFIKDNLGGQPKAKENRSIIEQYSPELFGVLNNLIQMGKSPQEAGALAQREEQFSKAINKMEADHKTPFSAILETTFGSAQQPQQNQGSQPQQQGQPQSGGQGQQALMAILQKIQQQRGQG